MGLLRQSSRGSRFIGRRSAVLAVIVGLHGVAVAGLLRMTVQPPREQAIPAIKAVLIMSQDVEQPAPRLVPEFQVPDVEVPAMRIEPAMSLPRPSALRTAVVAQPELPRASAPRPPAQGDLPVELQVVEYLEHRAPRYPPLAKRARAQGTVFLRVIIDEAGRPREVSVERSSGHELLDKAACDAVRTWLFRPHRENGVARSASALVPVEFSISGRRG